MGKRNDVLSTMNIFLQTNFCHAKRNVSFSEKFCGKKSEKRGTLLLFRALFFLSDGRHDNGNQNIRSTFFKPCLLVFDIAELS